jgi:hypothetical protein
MNKIAVADKLENKKHIKSILYTCIDKPWHDDMTIV